MADNVTLPSMAGGAMLATDECTVHGTAGVQVQRVKLGTGANGTYDGDVSDANPLPIDDAGGSVTVDGTLTANLAPTTSGGLSVSRTISTAAVMAVSAKASAGQLYGWIVSSLDATPVYLKIYNVAGVPTASDTPILTIGVPANATAALGVLERMTYENGIAFSTGIGYRCSTGIADADTGALSANEVFVTLLYK